MSNMNLDDSDLSASELKRRYHRGGSAKDDELSAAQLRARHAIPSNSRDFSTKNNKQKNQAYATIAGIGAIIAIIILTWYLSKL